MPRRSFLVAAAALAVTFSSACNRELQGHADVLLAALDADDFAKFETVASAELLEEASEARFHETAATYLRLGPRKDKTMNGTHWNNGERKVTYMLEHERGEVQLTVISRSDRLDGFGFKGPDWDKAYLLRHREALEGLLEAGSGSDRAAARQLVHASIPDADLDGLLAKLATLGAHTSIEVADETIPAHRVTFAKAELIVTLRLSGDEIVGYSVRPATAG